MISSFYFVAGSSVYEIKKEDTAWSLVENKINHVFLCLTADPVKRGRLFGGTFEDGLWISDDYGKTWQPAGEGIVHNRILSVEVSPTEVVDRHVLFGWVQNQVDYPVQKAVMMLLFYAIFL